MWLAHCLYIYVGLFCGLGTKLSTKRFYLREHKTVVSATKIKTINDVSLCWQV